MSMRFSELDRVLVLLKDVVQRARRQSDAKNTGSYWDKISFADMADSLHPSNSLRMIVTHVGPAIASSFLGRGSRINAGSVGKRGHEFWGSALGMGFAGSFISRDSKFWRCWLL